MASPVQRGTSSGTTSLPVGHSALVDVDFLNAGALVIARKTTAKAVTNTTAETDLLNGEFTLPANLLGTKGLMRLTMWGDGKWNAGGTQRPPRLRFKVGAGPTTLLDTDISGSASFGNSATRGSWFARVEMQNLGATNAQLVHIHAVVSEPNMVSGATGGAFATGQGVYAQTNLVTSTTPGQATAEGINTAAIDTTADQALLFTVVNGSGATTEFQLLGAILEIV